ncbi:50S ribosomal protein L11 methyltransferase [Candidatus Woesearchaeota archaeon]|nr:50S ribosomal protein L11 methyltransferase [Candidatus Woesearchaeota archaeon]
MLKDALKGKLSAKELNLLRRSFDVVGDIAIFEVPDELKKKEKLIGNTILELLSNVKVVAVEQGEHKGAFRRQKLKVVAGEKRLVTTHKESGVVLALDVEKCYYSPRLGSERLRVASLITPGEKVLVAGSGVGVYPIVLAKHSVAAKIVGVEINPVAHKFALQNIKLNKVSDKVQAIKGDVFKLKLGKFDRIILAMPTFGVKFVPQLLKFAKNGAFLHVLDFAEESDREAPARLLREICEKKKRPCTILGVIKTGTPGVRRLRVCVDVKLYPNMFK